MNEFAAEIQWRDPATLVPYALNAKTHPQDQVDKIAASIAAFGFDQPIAIDADGIIIKGHGRHLASLKLGLQLVPVIVRDDLSEAEKKAARIADNKIAESEWDREALAVEFEALAELDFDLKLTGFSNAEVGGENIDLPAGEISSREVMVRRTIFFPQQNQKSVLDQVGAILRANGGSISK